MSKCKIFSYHPYNSCGTGGVESLIRSFHSILRGNFIELYSSEYGDKLVCDNIDDVKIKIGKEGNGIFSKIYTKISIYRYFKKKLSSNIVILYSPLALLYLPLNRRNQKVILVQTNSFEKIFTLRARILMFFREKYIDAYTVYTESDKKLLLKYYPSLSGKIYVIPRGCRIETKKSISTYSKKLVTIARIEEKQKNFDAMILIMDALGKDYSLDIYGSGTEQEILFLKNKIKNYSNIKYKGISCDVAMTLNSYSLFIITSNYEGFGQTLIEARSQGLPVVGFDVYASFSWIVEQDYNGKGIKKGDYNSFNKAIKDITLSKEIYNKYSENALIKSKETKIDEINKKWIHLFNILKS